MVHSSLAAPPNDFPFRRAITVSDKGQHPGLWVSHSPVTPLIPTTESSPNPTLRRTVRGCLNLPGADHERSTCSGPAWRRSGDAIPPIRVTRIWPVRRSTVRQQMRGSPASRTGVLQGISRQGATGTGYRQRGLGPIGPRPPPIGVQIRLAAVFDKIK